MAEKKGNTVKLIYDFPTQLSTEVLTDDWVRVTCKNFRSFYGQRRILKFNLKNEPYYEDYTGPVYFFETNIKVNNPQSSGYQYLNGRRPESKLRQYENYS
jgi:hypothetical protein